MTCPNGCLSSEKNHDEIGCDVMQCPIGFPYTEGNMLKCPLGFLSSGESKMLWPLGIPTCEIIR